MKNSATNKDERVVAGFSDEWSRFDQARLGEHDRHEMFGDFFAIFPWERISRSSIGADIGCGTGRWAKDVAPRVGHLHMIDASDVVLGIAQRNMRAAKNVSFHHCSVDAIPLAAESLDFAYSLGVLHHVPDTAAAIRSVVRKLKTGAPILVYLYYSFDNRPVWFRVLWSISNGVRLLVCRLPRVLRYVVCDAIALCVYWPLARIGKLLERARIMPDSWPLSWYRDRALYVMRTDALDRFGTCLERRFSRTQIESMLTVAGVSQIRFSERPPYWCAIGVKT